MLMETSHIAPCYAYRDRLNDETEEAYGLRIADQLEVEILRLGSHNVAGFIAETVGGATAGVLPPVAGYFKRIREICNRYGVMMILDEVMCGMGRTGVLFACEKDGVAPDIICVAKGLGGGYQPIGAALLSQKIFDAFRNGSGVFQHGHTYMGHTTACAASLAVQRKIQDYDLLTNVRDQGVYLMDCLKQRFGNHTNVGDIRGRGLFVGIELVADRASKEPFDPTANVNGRIKMEAMDRGLICYPSGGTKDGVCGDHVLLAPPFIVNRDHIDELVDKLGGAVDAALRLAGV
jgi:hypothetical protein